MRNEVFWGIVAACSVVALCAVALCLRYRSQMRKTIKMYNDLTEPAAGGALEEVGKDGRRLKKSLINDNEEGTAEMRIL